MNFCDFEWHLEQGLSSAHQTGATHGVINIDQDPVSDFDDLDAVT
jgi:hypothetical protein